MEDWVLWLASLSVAFTVIKLAFLCLRIKSTKKTPELLGTAGTVKVIGAAASDESLPPVTLRDGAPLPQARTVSTSTPSPGARGGPSPRPPMIAGGGEQRKLPELPPAGNNNIYENGSVAGSDMMYDTVGYSTVDKGGAVGGGVGGGGGAGNASDDSDGPRGGDEAAGSGDGTARGAAANHPYAKVKKKEHPYATVKKPQAPPVPNTSGSGGGGGSNTAGGSAGGGEVNYHPLGAAVSAAPPPLAPSSLTGHQPARSQEGAGPGIGEDRPVQQQYFSGDSQDSSKGYTSISVREPLSHIQIGPPQASNASAAAERASGGGVGSWFVRATAGGASRVTPAGAGGPTDAPYMAVSEASDDMYAAIEDPSYIPTGTSQSNSDTYAVINLPGEEDEEIDGGGGGGGGTVSLPPAPLSSEDAHEKVHHYSKIDKSKKRRPPDPPPGHGVNIRPHSLVPQPPIPTMQQHPQLQQRRSFNVDEMYAKVHKVTDSPSLPPELPPACPPRTSPFGKRGDGGTGVGSGTPQPLPPSKMKTATVSRRNVSPQQPLRPVSQPQLPPQTENFAPAGTPGDTGYERVKDWRERGPGGVSTPVAAEDGYERVPSFKSRLKRKDSEAGPGYETVPPALPPSGPSRLSPSTPSYETVPPAPPTALASSSRTRLDSVPGCGTVPADMRPRTDSDLAGPGYETVSHEPPGSVPGRQRIDSVPGYETVPPLSHHHTGTRPKAPTELVPGYETVPSASADPMTDPPHLRRRNDSVGPGYETVPTASGSSYPVRNRKDSTNVPGYETVPPAPPREPPYAKLTNNSDTEEGYETIPGQKLPAHRPPYHDPGYESVPAPPAAPVVPDPGYETVPGQYQPRPISSLAAVGTTASPGLDVAPTYADPVDAVLQQQLNQQPPSLRDMPASSAAASVTSSQGSGQDRRSSVVVIEHVGASISMVATTSSTSSTPAPSIVGNSALPELPSADPPPPPSLGQPHHPRQSSSSSSLGNTHIFV